MNKRLESTRRELEALLNDTKVKARRLAINMDHSRPTEHNQYWGMVSDLEDMRYATRTAAEQPAKKKPQEKRVAKKKTNNPVQKPATSETPSVRDTIIGYVQRLQKYGFDEADTSTMTEELNTRRIPVIGYVQPKGWEQISTRSLGKYLHGLEDDLGIQRTAIGVWALS